MQELEFVKEIADNIDKLKLKQRSSYMQFEKRIAEEKVKLDSAMLAAVDFGGRTRSEVAKVAGYAGYWVFNAIRKREEERRIEVR